MSTRCNIKIFDKEGEVILYHHHDGYPEGVGKDLFDRFNDKLKENRFIRALDIANRLIKDYGDYELTNGIHGDIEYLYEIDLINRKLLCFNISWTGQNMDIMKKTVISLEEIFNK